MATSALSVLHLRSVRVKCVSLCPSMDLCVLVTSEGTVGVYRTISWERIWLKDASELFESTSTPTAAAIAPTGRVLAVGFENGDVGVADVETALAILVSPLLRGAKSAGSDDAVQSLYWVQHLSDDTTSANVERSLWRPFAEPGNDSNNKPVEEIIVSSALDLLLMTFTSRDRLTVSRFGLWPLFTLTCRPDVMGCSYCGGLTDRLYLRFLNAKTEAGLSSNSQAITYVDFGYRNPIVSNLWLRSRRICLNCLHLSADLAVVMELIAAAGKKWKESIKPISAKMGLLHTAMQAYQLPMTCIEFLYSVTLCGLWHPAALNHFAQYWNEQALQRSRAAVESAADSILWTLSMKVLPRLTNCMLMCRYASCELRRFHRRAHNCLFCYCRDLEECIDEMRTGQNSVPDPRMAVFHRSMSGAVCSLRKSLEAVIMTLDKAVIESKHARNAMSTYFVVRVLCMWRNDVL
jgi:hypothetical protein